ncbi:hypothetical protein PF007_g26718 [Phytophthora fragariae]|uniref:Uncharacterized protein n=2 Tax=Phytophthora fragariae TaxID=53985 RepID=A0A6A3Q8J9_9STRA|nr:hypothetical protein PF007_g26718 [Phytophthora fragariae]
MLAVVPLKGVEFFDVSGLLANPEKLQLTFDHFVQAVVPFMNEVDAIGCFDARGFLFAPYLFALFQTRVCMLRKPDKMPSVSDTIEYFKGYKTTSFCSWTTCEAGIRFVQQAGASAPTCIFMVEIAVRGRGRAIKASTDEKTQGISLLTEKDF